MIAKAAALLFLIGSAAGCSGGGASSQSPEPTTATTKSATEPTTTVEQPPPPLTHKQFIRTLDRLCKLGNRASARKFTFGDIYDTVESMDAYAVKLARLIRFVAKWDRKHHFFELDPGEPEDIRNYDRYKELTKRLRNYDARQVIAARRHEFEEIARLLDLQDTTRNQRTRLTADMGLRFCGG
jgi:hypothetical protein